MNDDRIDLILRFERNLFRAAEQTNAVLDVLERSEHFAPKALVDVQEKPYSRAAVDGELAHYEQTLGRARAKLVLRVGEKGTNVSLYGEKRGGPKTSMLTFSAPLSFVTDEHGDARSDELVAIVEALAKILTPIIGWAHLDADAELAGDPNIKTPSEATQPNQVYWLNVFGPAIVKQLGEERVRATPAARVDELPRGAFLLLTTPRARDVLSDDARVAQARAAAHLLGRDYDRTLAELRARTAKLAPPSVQFDPDVAPLFEHALAKARPSERAELARELAALDLAVTEQRPAAGAPPSDVDDPAQAARAYAQAGDDFAIQYTDEIPGIAQLEPDALLPLDKYLYDRDLPHARPQSWVQNELFLMLGGYLGHLMVVHLDGEWVPRRDPLEAQVIIGDRAWLPFLRVRRFLASRQANLQYSLTKLYREAERHARAR